MANGTTMNAALFEALRDAGIDEGHAARVAKTVPPAETMVTQVEFQTEIQDVRAAIPEPGSVADKAVTDEKFDRVLAEIQALREETKDLREEMRAEFKAVREEMKAESQALREEMRAEFKAVREEMKAEFKAVREEMKAESKALREEIDGVRKEMASTNTKIDRVDERAIGDRKIFLIILAVLLAVGAGVFQLLLP